MSTRRSFFTAMAGAGLMLVGAPAVAAADPTDDTRPIKLEYLSCCYDWCSRQYIVSGRYLGPETVKVRFRFGWYKGRRVAKARLLFNSRYAPYSGWETIDTRRTVTFRGQEWDLVVIRHRDDNRETSKLIAEVAPASVVDLTR